MKIPYTFLFTEEPSSPNQALPFWCSYPMPAASHTCHYISQDTELLSQQLNHRPFFIDLIEIKQKQSSSVPFRAHVKGLFAYFMLEGSLAIKTPEQEILMVTRRNTLQVCMFNPGLYELAAAPGNHAMFIVNIRPKWMEKNLSMLTRVQEIIPQFYASDKPFRMWAKCRGDRKVRNWISKIHNSSQQYMVALDGYLKTNITLLLDFYNDAIGYENTERTGDVKQYILDNYTDPDLNVETVAEKFNITRQTLRNHFLRTYGCNVHEYYTSLRRKKAQELLKTPGIKPVHIFGEVGYRDVRTLRAMLKASQEQKTLKG